MRDVKSVNNNIRENAQNVPPNYFLRQNHLQLYDLLVFSPLVNCIIIYYCRKLYYFILFFKASPIDYMCVCVCVIPRL